MILRDKNLLNPFLILVNIVFKTVQETANLLITVTSSKYKQLQMASFISKMQPITKQICRWENEINLLAAN